MIQLTGVMLILAFITFGVGASIPLVGKKGNMQFYGLPLRDYLLAISGNVTMWRWANYFMGAAGVILLAGLTMLTTTLEERNERTLSRLGLIVFVVAAVLWVAFSAFRATTTVSAAQEIEERGTIPAYYEPLARWSGGLFTAYAVTGFVALVVYGSSLLQTGLVPGWAAWGTIIFSLGMLALLLLKDDTLPAFHYLPGLLIGILLVLS